MTSLPDLFTIILCNIPDSTRDGDPEAVADLTSGCEDLHTALTPLVEVLSHPENLAHIEDFRLWLLDNGPSTTEVDAADAAIISLLNAVNGLTNE